MDGKTNLPGGTSNRAASETLSNSARRRILDDLILLRKSRDYSAAVNNNITKDVMYLKNEEAKAFLIYLAVEGAKNDNDEGEKNRIIVLGAWGLLPQYQDDKSLGKRRERVKEDIGYDSKAENLYYLENENFKAIIEHFAGDFASPERVKQLIAAAEAEYYAEDKTVEDRNGKHPGRAILPQLPTPEFKAKVKQATTGAVPSDAEDADRQFSFGDTTAPAAKKDETGEPAHEPAKPETEGVGSGDSSAIADEKDEPGESAYEPKEPDSTEDDEDWHDKHKSSRRSRSRKEDESASLTLASLETSDSTRSDTESSTAPEDSKGRHRERRHREPMPKNVKKLLIGLPTTMIIMFALLWVVVSIQEYIENYEFTFAVDLKARFDGDKTWQDDLYRARVGDVVQFQFEVVNKRDWLGSLWYSMSEKLGFTAGTQDVILRYILPDNLEYIPGTTVFYNSSNPTGLVLKEETATTSGVNVGEFALNANAYLRILCRVTDTNLSQGENVLETGANATIYGKVEYDLAYVHLVY